MDPGLIWILAGLALLGAEMLLPGVYLVWIGLASVGTGLALMIFAVGFGWAVAIFLVLLALGIGLSLRFRPKRGLASRVNAPEAGLAGRRGTVAAVEGTGLRVRLGDSDWPARLAGGAAMPGLGATVRVEAVDGTELVVRPE
jgi:membrane protein implicated in regulation of membrane protease activity